MEGILIGKEDAIRIDCDGSWKEDFFEEDGAFIRFSVLVGIFEDDDTAEGLVFVFAIDIEHVADHFTDPETSCWIVVKSDGLLDHGLGSEREHGKSLCDLKRFYGILRREHGGWRNEVGWDNRFHVVVTLAIALLGEQGRR